MRLIKILAIVLGSGPFFFVSLMSGCVVGTQVVAKLDERQVARGDRLHNHFKVVAEPGEGERPFQEISILKFPELVSGTQDKTTWLQPDCYECKNFSFYMKSPAGKIDLEGVKISYKVLEESKTEQLIEVVEAAHDGDNTIWSRYRATKDGIIPISSRMFYFGYMFGAMPYAFVFALIIFGMGRLLRRRLVARSV